MLTMTRRLKWVSFSLIVGVSALVACTDDLEVTPADPPGLPEAGTIPDGSAPPDPDPDSSTPLPPPEDAGVDANENEGDADSDKVTASMGSTGTISIYNFMVVGEFFEDNLIVRSTLAPDCVMHIRSVTKPPSAAGTITVSSDLDSELGGPEAPLVTEPDENNGYTGFFEDESMFFPFSGGANKVQLELTGTITMPPIPVTTLNAPVHETIAITNPLTPADGTLHVPIDKDFTVTWTVPADADAGADAGAIPQRVSLGAYMVQSVKYEGQLRCSWPLSQGTATVPAAVLTEFRERLGGTGAATGRLEFFAGDAKEVAVDGASYVVLVSHFEATDFAVSDLSLE